MYLIGIQRSEQTLCTQLLFPLDIDITPFPLVGEGKREIPSVMDVGGCRDEIPVDEFVHDPAAPGGRKVHDRRQVLGGDGSVGSDGGDAFDLVGGEAMFLPDFIAEIASFLDLQNLVNHFLSLDNRLDY
jgi:hypothetical protein